MERLSWRSHVRRSRYAVEERKNVRSEPSLIFFVGVVKGWVDGFARRESFGITEGGVGVAMVWLHCFCIVSVISMFLCVFVRE